MADDDSSTVLSDVDDDDAASASVAADSSPSISNHSDQQNLLLLAQLEDARRARDASDKALKDSESRLTRLKAFAQDVIKKRDDALRSQSDAASQRDDLSRQLHSLHSEIATLTQMLTSGMEKISGKISAYTTFPDGLPTTHKYTGLPALAYGVIKRSNDIVEELLRQVDLASKSRDQATETMEHRNYEIAIEVSQLEAKISALREVLSHKESDIEKLTGSVAQMEAELSDLRRFRDEADNKARALEAKLDSQRPLFLEQLNFLSKLHEQIHDIDKVVSLDGKSDDTEPTSSVFMSNEVDSDENLKVLLDGLKSVVELAGVAKEKVRHKMDKTNGEVKSLHEKVDALIEEKKHIGTLLRSVLSSNKSEVLQVAEEGLREAGIDLKLDGKERSSLGEAHDDEVYTLAGALGNTVKESQIKIIELQHLVEALRAESSLLKARLDAQTKEINQQKLQIKDLEVKERTANESVEGLMMDITAAEEEILRWKAAAEEEAAAGGAVEKEFQSQILALQKELEDRKQAMLELENKLKFKEETAAAAMAAREAAEKSLKLADIRSTRLRQRLEELSRQVEQSDGQGSSLAGPSGVRYACWPWQWLGLNFVRYSGQAEALESSNEMELSEPLI
ncbi:paramyosin [Rhynchospora pubera]|uniref:Paramyosin n=1 Tax=Rhynchospora pubera TaxID=906938 RepID=A0AAV8EF73_9POAL|nr:paramyosin [Rhynchospora pubera]